jgi:hypothetical protein
MIVPTSRAAVLLAALAFGATLSADASAQQDTARSRELFRKAMKEYEQGKTREAYDDYRAAWEAQKSYDIAGNLANVELELGRYRDAAEHATYALANFPPVGTEKARALLQDLLKEARGKIGTITIKVNLPRAGLTIDGKAAGEAPLTDPIFMEPGDHVIIAAAPEHEPAKENIHVDKGSFHTVTLTLVKRGAIDVAPVVKPGPDPLVVGGFIAAGLLGGVGGAMAILSKVKATDADAKLTAIDKASHGSASACAGASPSPDCTALHDLRHSRDVFANAALWTFVASGAVTAGTLVYTFVGPRAAPAKKGASVQAAPMAGPGAGGLLVKGTF